MVEVQSMNIFWFYWVMWGFFLMVAFFFKKGGQKTGLMVLLLIVIALSPLAIPIGSVHVNLSYVLIGLTGCAMLSGDSVIKVIHMAMASFIIMFVDILAQIYWLYDPAILIVLPKWTFIVFIGFFTVTLTNDFWNRITLILIGMSQAEVLQSLVFYPYDNTLGDVEYLVTVAFILAVIVSWEMLTQGVFVLKLVTENTTEKRITK